MTEPDKVAQLRELIEMDPDDAVLHYGLGCEHLRRGEFEAAIEPLLRALELQPDYSAAHRELGKSLEKLNRREEAVAAYRRGHEVAKRRGDLQTAREIEVFLKRLETS
ncbi:MAG TPA: tetratricopeptide repeat protein [Candidatus Acidoferrales bacterium]|nr:tetratricopeptide repeat protein [Candidatus Acidoferrales bacterium]